MLPEIPPEEFAAALDDVVWEALAAAGIVDPPVDAFGVAESLGCVIAWDDRQAGRARRVRQTAPRGLAAVSTILLRHDPRAERRQWAVAHELGEDRALGVFERLGIDGSDAPPDAREAVANQLASRLLLPTAWFGRDGGEANWDLLSLKSLYGTASHELIARRMLDFSAGIVMTVVDGGRITQRRSNLPGGLWSPLPSELRCWQVVHRTGRDHETKGDSLHVRGWAIHEAEWKREILRTEPLE